MNRKLFDAQIAQYATPIVTGGSSVTYKDGIKCYLPRLEASGNTIQTLLPVEYQQVEYIESTGTQYIDTGVLASENNSFEVKAQLVHTNTASQTIWGGRNSATNNEIQGNQLSCVKANQSYQFNCGNIAIAGDAFDKNLHIYKASKNALYIDGNLSCTVATSQITTENNVYLFATNTNGDVGFGGGDLKIYYCKIWNNETLLRDYIPCYRKADNVIGLYDIVNNVFYTNQGTGIFLKGKDYIPNPQYDAPQTITNFSEKHEEIIAKCKNLIDPDKLAEIIISKKGNQIAEIIEVDGRRCIRYMNSTTNSADFTPAISEPFKPNTKYIFSFEAKPYTPVPETSQYSGNLWFGFKPSGTYAQVGFNGKTDLEFSRKSCTSNGKTVSDIHLSWGAMHSWLIDLDSIYLYEYWGNSNPDYMPHHSIDEYKDEWEELEIKGINSLITPKDFSYSLADNYINYDISTQTYDINFVNSGTSQSICHFDTPIPAGTPYTLLAEVLNDDFEISEGDGTLVLGLYKKDNTGAAWAGRTLNLRDLITNKVITQSNTTTQPTTDIWFFRNASSTYYTKKLRVRFMVVFGDTSVSKWEPYVEPRKIKIPPKIGNLVLKFAKYGDTYDSLEVDGITKKVIYTERLKDIVIGEGYWSAKYYYASSMGIQVSAFLPQNGSRQKGYCSHATQLQVGGANAYSKGGLWLGVNNNYVYWIGIITLLGLDAGWVSKSAPTDEEWTTARNSFRAWLKEQEANGNPFRAVYVLPNAGITEHDITDSEFGQQLLSSLIEENGTNTIEITNDNGIGRTITAKYLTHA